MASQSSHLPRLYRLVPQLGLTRFSALPPFYEMISFRPPYQLQKISSFGSHSSALGCASNELTLDCDAPGRDIQPRFPDVDLFRSFRSSAKSTHTNPLTWSQRGGPLLGVLGAVRAPQTSLSMPIDHTIRGRDCLPRPVRATVCSPCRLTDHVEVAVSLAIATAGSD